MVFRISSENNSRTYNGTTYFKTNDPYDQRIRLTDIPQRNGTYEVEFTDIELKSSDKFCKATKTIECKRTHFITNYKINIVIMLIRLLEPITVLWAFFSVSGDLGVGFGKVSNLKLLRRLNDEFSAFEDDEN